MSLPPIPKYKKKKPTKHDAGSSKSHSRIKAKKKLEEAKAEGDQVAVEEATQKIAALKKADILVEGGTVITSEEELELLPPTVKQYIEPKVIFAPHPGPQEDFLAASEMEVLYGGAAGGGKSYALIADPLRHCNNRNFSGIIFRRTNDELRELIFKSKELYPQAYPGAKWSEQKGTWTFPSGAMLWYTYLDRDDDVLRYQGQAFTYVGFDELTQWPTPFAFDYMRSRLRTSSPDLPVYMRATANPGNRGGWWVRKMFIDQAVWGKAFPATDMDSGEPLVYPPSHKRAGEPLFYRRFIPARLSDNPSLFEDGRYEANLLSLPTALRRQLLEGDWDTCEGAAFPEFSRSAHVIEPFEIPRSWSRFRAADWGYTSPFCVLWFAVDHDQNLYVYREWYHKGLTADVFADGVLDRERGERIQYGVMDASLWAKRGETGPGIIEEMFRKGCMWRPSDRSKDSREHGKLEVHRRLQPNRFTGKPSVFIFNTCLNLIRTLPMLPVDKNKPEDVDTKTEDHAYDAFRYGCASRPLNPLSNGNEFSDWSSSVREGYQPVDEEFGY
jgi:hypothetical protein